MAYSSFQEPELGDNIASTPVATQFGLLVIIVILLVQLTRISKKKGGEGNDGYGKQKPSRTVEDFPCKSYFPFKIPTIFEGLLTLYQFHRVSWKYLFATDGVIFLEKMAQQYGPIYQFPFMTTNTLAIHDPVLIQKILGCTETYVLNKPRIFYDIFFVEWLRGGLLANEVEIWAPHRKMVARTVTYKILPTYLKMMNKHSKALISDLVSVSTSSSQGVMRGQIMHDLLYSHSIKIISEIVLGSGSSSRSHSKELHEHFKKFKTMIVDKFWNPINLLPPVWWLNPKKKEYDLHVSEIRKHINKDIDKCKAELQQQSSLKTQEEKDASGGVEGIKPFRSLIEEMLYCKADDKEIYDEVGTFLSAGHETTVVGIHFFMQHLAENPEIQMKCQEELDELFDSKIMVNGDCDKETDWDYLTMDDLSNLKYLERCILETLRMTAVVPAILRQLSAPMEIDDLKFKTGTTFFFSPWVVHRDPKNYPNPEKFDPDRFFPENIKKRHPFAFIPFGQGPRICIGSKLAIMEMKVVLAWMLRHFDFHTSDRLQDVKILFEITIFPERNYNIMLRRRKHASAGDGICKVPKQEILIG